MKKVQYVKTILTAALLFCGSFEFTFSQSNMNVAIDTGSVITEIPSNFEGLSFETENILPDRNGRYYFRSGNYELISLFKQLGIKSLRIGGNTADRPSVPVPDKKDIDSLFSFARAAGLKVIYTLRLREENEKAAAEIAEYIMHHYKEHLECFAVGNEPNMYTKKYDGYKNEWLKYTRLITSGVYSREAKFCGPSTTPGRTSWCINFADDFAGSGLIDFISQHAYPGGNGEKVQNTGRARKEMLSEKWIKSYEKFYDSFAPEIQEKGLRYRIEETNSYYNGGAPGVSNTFASALWGLDYMYWWASHNALGLNFHTGDKVAAGESNNVCRYAVYVTSERGGYTVRPLGYAMKAFDIAGKGKLLSTKITSDKSNPNVDIYASCPGKGRIFVTVINKETGPGGREADIKFNLNVKIESAQVMFLNSNDGDVSAATGVELGDAQIKNNGEWTGKWQDISEDIKGNFLNFKIDAAYAAIIELKII